MTRCLIRLTGKFFSGVLMWLIVGTASPQQSLTEVQIKASYLYNFVLFSRWPAESFATPASPFVLCIAGDKALAFTLEAQTQQRQVEQRALEVRNLEAQDSAQDCHLLYVGQDAIRYEISWLTATAGRAVLTVGERDRFIRRGGMISFREIAGRVRFIVNPIAARQANIELGAHILKAAYLVEGSPP